jgi:hypothetical protein
MRNPDGKTAIVNFSPEPSQPLSASLYSPLSLTWIDDTPLKKGRKGFAQVSHFMVVS